jgi:hypothetical protein
MESHPRLFSREPFEHGHQESGCNRLGTPDPQFTSLWIGDELDVSDSLTQLIEGSSGSRQ